MNSGYTNKKEEKKFSNADEVTLYQQDISHNQPCTQEKNREYRVNNNNSNDNVRSHIDWRGEGNEAFLIRM